MIRITNCPRCKSDIEISEHKKESENIDSIGVFCKNEECTYHKNALIGLDRKEPGAYISECLTQLESPEPLI
jgi:hypothetical protein